jgi:hypothetical protein
MRFDNTQILGHFLGVDMIFGLITKVTQMIALRVLEVHTLIQSINVIKRHGRNSAEPLKVALLR